MPTYGTMRKVTSEGVTGTLSQPVADVVAQLAAHGGRNVGTIGNADHLWDGGSPRTVANRRHGDHTPWSSDGPAGYIMAVDVKSLPGISPVDLWHRFVTPCVKAGLYPEFKYGISDYVLRDSRAPFNMRDQKGGDGPGWLHLSFRPSHYKKHSAIIEDAVAWHKAGRPNPVTFVNNRRNPATDTTEDGFLMGLPDKAQFEMRDQVASLWRQVNGAGTDDRRALVVRINDVEAKLDRVLELLEKGAA